MPFQDSVFASPDVCPQLHLRMDVDRPEDRPDHAVFIPRPLPQGPRSPGCLPIRLFMMMQLLAHAPLFKIGPSETNGGIPWNIDKPKLFFHKVEPFYFGL